MESEPLTVSVVIPVFNGSSHVERAVESVMQQSERVLEIIIVNDGSTDGSAELIEQIVARESPIDVRAIHQANAGQSAARNAAVAQANGQLIAFLDQDDLWLRDHVRLLTPHFESDPRVGLVFGDFDEIDGQGNLVTRRFIASHGVHYPRTTVRDWLGSDTMIVPSAAMVRADALRQTGGFDPQLSGYEDDDLWLRMFRAGWDYVYVKESVSQFRVHFGSSSSGASFRVSRLRFYNKIAAMIPDDPARWRFYVSDVLRPRLVASAMAEFGAAVQADRLDDASAVADTIDAMLASTGKRFLRPHERWALKSIARMRWARRFGRLIPGRGARFSKRVTHALERPKQSRARGDQRPQATDS